MTATCDNGTCTFTGPCTLMAGACNACGVCETSTMIDFTTGSETFNDAGEFSGGTPPVFPNYDPATNTGTFILPVGSDEIFTVAGVRNLDLPDDVTDICYTADINVISGTPPISIEFRIENAANGGERISWDVTVDGDGTCSIGGSLANGMPTGGWPGFTNGALYTTAFAVVYFGADPPLTEQVEIEISNWSLSVCSPAANPLTSPATPVVTDDTCPDGMTIVPGSIDYTATTCPEGTTIEYSVDNGATWDVVAPAYSDVVAASGTLNVRCLCDNGAPPDMVYASASTISTTDPTRICIDGVGDPINVSIDVDGGATGTWVITDAANTIVMTLLLR